MKLRSDSESKREKGKRPNEGDDRCEMVIDENLVISFGSDYDPGEENDAESEGNVSLEEVNIRDFKRVNVVGAMTRKRMIRKVQLSKEEHNLVKGSRSV